MRKKTTAILLGLVLLFVSLPACADFGSVGSMIFPAILASVPQSRLTNVSGPAATDPEVSTYAAHLKLPGASFCKLSRESGKKPDKITVSYRKPEDYSHPEQADCYVITEQMTEAEVSAAEARVSAPFSEKDLMLLTLKIKGVDCVLGTSTPQDLADAGLYVTREYDGTVTITATDDPYGCIYAKTVGGTMDSPIYDINAYWGNEIPIEYCGVILSEPTVGTEDDSDNDRNDDNSEPSDENNLRGIWQVLAELTDNPFDVEESEEGIASTVITLSNGQELYISEHSSPVSLTLLGMGAD